jgi:hypothetical protein
MAQRGGVNVLSGAPYGYRYVKKSSLGGVLSLMEAEAQVVRMVFETYARIASRHRSLLSDARLVHGQAKAVGAIHCLGHATQSAYRGRSLLLQEPSSVPGSVSARRQRKPCRVATLVVCGPRAEWLRCLCLRW